ncbi:MAG: DUF721 domain-containing protein [bacterium]
MNSKKIQSLGDVLALLLHNLGIENRIKEQEAIDKWPIIVGRRVSEVTSAEKTVDGILFVRVKSAVWRNELLYLKHKIINTMNEHLGKKIIKDIRFI